MQRGLEMKEVQDEGGKEADGWHRTPPHPLHLARRPGSAAVTCLDTGPVPRVKKKNDEVSRLRDLLGPVTIAKKDKKKCLDPWAVSWAM